MLGVEFCFEHELWNEIWSTQTHGMGRWKCFWIHVSYHERGTHKWLYRVKLYLWIIKIALAVQNLCSYMEENKKKWKCAQIRKKSIIFRCSKHHSKCSSFWQIAFSFQTLFYVCIEWGKNVRIFSFKFSSHFFVRSSMIYFIIRQLVWCNFFSHFSVTLFIHTCWRSKFLVWIHGQLEKKSTHKKWKEGSMEWKKTQWLASSV